MTRMNTNSAAHGSPADSESDRFWASALWAPFVVPFMVYALIGSIEPQAPRAAVQPAVAIDDDAAEVVADSAEPNWLGFSIAYEHYPLIYTVKISATIAALVIFWPAYRSPALWGHQSSPTVHGSEGHDAEGRNEFHITALAVLVGVVGAALWIALCYVPLAKILTPLGIGDWFATDDRPAFNPFEQLKSNPAWMYAFLAIRFVGLVLVVAMMEELFLRGFIMRFVMHANWSQIPFGEVNAVAIAVGTIIPILSHPLNELLAVIVWFSLVTWLMVRTKNFWDCVAAHAITNLILGIYVVVRGEWWLW